MLSWRRGKRDVMCIYVRSSVVGLRAYFEICFGHGAKAEKKVIRAFPPFSFNRLLKFFSFFPPVADTKPFVRSRGLLLFCTPQ